MRETADSRLITRSCAALALMSVRYWATVLAQARRELHRWRDQAQAIADPGLRALALGKLSEEKTNVYFAGTFATLAPHSQRARAIKVIVAVQIIYDYLDGLTEQPTNEPVRDGLQLFRALSDALTLLAPACSDYYSHHPNREDGGYLNTLVATARTNLARLPAAGTITELASAAATRCAGAQVHAHAAAQLGTAQVEQWAIDQAPENVPWRAFLAGAASAVISIHALIATAADPRTTPESAARIDAFHESTCRLATILDGFADLRHDETSPAAIGYLHYFPDRELLGKELQCAAHRAKEQAAAVPHGGHHLMTLAGVAAYYLSALRREDEQIKTLLAPLQHELQPTIAPTLLFMRTWRLAHHLRQQ